MLFFNPEAAVRQKPVAYISLRQFQRILKRQTLPPFTEKHEGRLLRILKKLKRLAADGDRMLVDWRMLEAKKRKVMKLINDLKSEPNEKLTYRVTAELNCILNELNIMADHKFRVINKVKKMGYQLKVISDEINFDLKRMKDQNGNNSQIDNVMKNERKREFDMRRKKKKKKRMRRIRQNCQQNTDNTRDVKADSTINS